MVRRLTVGERRFRTAAAAPRVEHYRKGGGTPLRLEHTLTIIVISQKPRESCRG
ncbi:hypothetical protein LPU83_pLPU83c_0358 (plasmid) [Rhizobium favelukesii]|uniref:Uncharacterized protein n=1 Tax=Rhizobium favelukesii TaxID=348824 RepID=W6RKX5_9HYPH|nr:hypothetical protein LPU83_pLPU83c_0358 [Rhizobium favelukesii]